MNANTFGYTAQDVEMSAAKSRRLRPALKAAAMVWGLYVVVAVVEVLTFGLYFPFTYGFQLLLSVLAGMVAGWLADRERDRSTAYGRLGATAGVLIPLFSTVSVIVLGLTLGFTTLGLSLSSSILSCVCFPVMLHLCLGMGWLGGKLYQGLWGRG